MMNPKNLTALVKQGSSNLVAKSRDVLRRLDPGARRTPDDLTTYDESVLQQGRFWMRTVTWSLIGTTVFGVAWLALARTEEIVVASWPARTGRLGAGHPDARGGCHRSDSC